MECCVTNCLIFSHVNWTAFVQSTCGDWWCLGFCTVVFFQSHSIHVSCFSHAHFIEVMSHVKHYNTFPNVFLCVFQAHFDLTVGTENSKSNSHSLTLSEHATWLMFNSVCCPLVVIFLNEGHISVKAEIKDTVLYWFTELYRFSSLEKKISFTSSLLLCFVFQWTAAFVRHVWERPCGHRSMLCR